MAWYRDYTGKSEYDSYGHGAVVAAALAGRAVSGFGGGVAPEAELYWGVTCYNTWCTADMARDAIADMGSRGVRLYNWSVGTTATDEDNLRRQAEGYAQWLRGVIDVDGLLVAAAGNDSSPEPSTTSLMPRFMQEWNRHLLVVAAVDLDKSGKATGLADYIGWLGANFDPSISWKDLQWIRDFWPGAMVIKGILDLQETAEDQREAPDFRENVSHVRRAGNQQNAGQQQHKPQCHVRPGQTFPDIRPQIADQQPSAGQNQSGRQGPCRHMGHCFIQQDQQQTDDEIK